MVERARLTPRLVFEAACPASGERWISDTKIKGFGLRLWSTKSGGQKAFAIRISDAHSRKVRRTFDPSTSWRARFKFQHSNRVNAYGLGEYLEEAREWARDEIDRLKGRPTLRDEHWNRHRDAGELVLALTLNDAASARLKGLASKNASEDYIYQLNKLFALHIPDEMKCTPLGKLNPKHTARTLVRSDASPGNVRALRSFLSQIIERGAAFHGPLLRFHDEFAQEFVLQWERNRDVRYPELRRLRPTRYQSLFNALEADEEYWQQAMAIRLYFAFHAPLSRVLASQWQQVHKKYWYPYWPNEKELWFESREAIDDSISKLLVRVRNLGERDFGATAYWFPSRHGRNANHIRSVEHAWQRALRASQIRYYPLREFSRSFRDFYNPSYLVSFLRQYQQVFREVQNAAQVSKELSAIKKR
jgi:hypothetical protein